jgi:hypothetical protein
MDLAEIGIRADVTQLQKAVNELNRLANQGDQTESRVTRSMGGVKAAFLSIAGALGVGNMAGKLIETERQTGILTSSLKTVTGSAKGAQQAFEAIQVLASQLPASVSDVTTAFTKMANLGLDPSEAAIRSYSNTAAAMGKDLMQMIEAVADASTFEFERLKEFGIKAKQQGDNVSFTFQGVTTTVKKNSDDIVGYLKKIGDVNFAGASADRMSELDGAISNLGDTWDGLFRTINESGAGDLIAKGVTSATEAIQELNDFIKSGQMGGYIDAIGERFSWVWDIAKKGVSTVIDAIQGMYGLWYMASNETLGAVGSSTDEYFAAVRDGFTSAPENIKAFIQVITVELAVLVDKAMAYGKSIAFYMKPKNWVNDAKAPNLTAALDGINKAREDSIQGIFNEKAAVESSYDAQIKKANDLRAAFDAKNNSAKGDVLGQYKKGGGAGVNAEDDLKAQKKAYDELNKSIKEHVELMESMESDINASIGSSFENNMTNLNESFDAAAENSKTLDDMIKKADEFGGAWSRTGSIIVDAFGSIADSLEDYTKKMEELRIQKEAADNFKPTNAIDEIKNEKLKIKLAEESTKAQIGGYGKIAGAAATMFSEQSKARKALNNAEKVFTAIEIGLALQKAAANAKSAITEAFAAPWPIGFASGAAMIAIMAGLGVFSGSSGGGGPSAADIQETQGTGTNLGDSSGKSDSISNAFDEYSDIALDQLAELRGIRSAMNSLSDGISGLAISLVRGGQFEGANISGLGKTNSTGIGGAISGWVLGTTTKKLVDTGLQIGSQELGDIMAGDFEAFYYNTIKTTKKKLFGLSKKTSTRDELTGADAGLSDQLSDIFIYLGSAVSGSLDVLGVDAANAIEAFQVNIGKISFKDLSGDEIQAELEAIFGAQADLLASYVLPQIEEYQRMGEGAFETLMRVSKEQAVFDDALEKMGVSLSGLSGLIRLDVAQSIIDLMGGLEEFSSKTSTYFEKFFREDEKIKMLGDSLKEAFGSIGQSVPATREAFRAIVEGIDYTSESGQYLFASLMELAPSLDQYISAIEKEAAAKEKATTATKDYAAIANKQADLQIQLMEAQGLATEALAARRSRELSLLDESLRPLQEQIWAQQDLNKAMDATNANMKRVADERYNLETRLLQAQGNTQALRERELAALDASNRPLQEQIWALEAKAEADASAAQSAQDAADAQQRAHDEAVQAAKDAAEEQARLIKGTQDALTGAIRKLRGESEQLNDLDRQRAKNTLNAALAAAQAGQSIVGFAGLEDALTAVSNIDKSAFVSAEDYQRELARTLSILDRLSGYAGMPTSSTTPIISNGALAMQTQTNQQMAQNMAAVEDKMTDLTVKIEENTKRTKMMLERWEAIGMPASRA